MLIATIAPYVKHRELIASCDVVDELRFNTVMPIAEPHEEVLKNLLEISGKKKLWIDLKTRQLRITEFAYLPYSYVKISHKIKVDLPATILFKDCEAKVVRIIEGDKLILEGRPERVVGRGEPINITDPSLEIEGFFTDNDLSYISAAKKLGIHNYMLSFVEKSVDINEMRSLDPGSNIIAKIESKKGLEFVKEEYLSKRVGFIKLMAARDDLFINTDKFKIFDALKLIKEASFEAIAASRILTSLENNEKVSLGDLADIKILKQMGYDNFMLSDGLCYDSEAFQKAVNIFKQIQSLWGTL